MSDEVVGRARLDLQRVAEQLDVAAAHLRRVLGRVELDLVEQLGRVAADEEEELDGAFGRERLRAGEVEHAAEPGTVVDQMVEEHRPPLGDGVVAEALLLHLQVRVGEGEVLGVARLVEERVPVVRPALRLDHEHHLAGDLDRGAEGARALRRPLLDVEVDVLLRVEVDAEVRERAAERGQHPVGGERLVPARAAEQPADVVSLGVREADPDALPQEPVHRVLVPALGRVEERAALGGEPFEVVLEAVAVEVEVGRRAELGDGALGRVDGAEVERVQVLLGQVVPGLLELRARVAVGGVGDRRRQHPVAHRLTLVLDLERRLELRDLLGALPCQLAEIALAAEAEELQVLPALHRLAEALDRLEVGQVGVALVDRPELEVGLQAGVVEVVLLVELGDEPVGAGSIAVELTVTERALVHAA